MEEVKALQEFLEHLQYSVYGHDGLMDTLNEGDYEERFDLKLELNGKSISLPLHADLFHRLTTLIVEEIEENQL